MGALVVEAALPVTEDETEERGVDKLRLRVLFVSIELGCLTRRSTTGACEAATAY